MRFVVATVVLGGCVVGERLRLEVPVVAGGTGEVVLADGLGGTIVLDEARVRFADLRLEEPPSTDVAATLLWALSPAVAYAHPGHDYPGDVAGELIGEFEVDLLAEDVELGLASCYEGRFATGRVTVSGTTAVLGGTHTDADGAERAFRFEVPADQDIVGIPFDARMSVSRPLAQVELRFDPALALSYVDWTAEDSDGDGVLTDADEIYGNTARFGVVATPTWSLQGVE